MAFCSMLKPAQAASKSYLPIWTLSSSEPARNVFPKFDPVLHIFPGSRLTRSLCMVGRRSWRVGVDLADIAGQKPSIRSHHTLSDSAPKPLTTVPPGASLPP